MSGAAIPELCGRVFEALIESGEVRDVALAEHLGSCMRCFRAMTDLRDAPRLASALRAETPALPEDDLFWQRLERRTVEATAAALAGAAALPVASAAETEVSMPAVPAAARTIAAGWGAHARRLGAIALGFAAAAAAVVVFVGSGPHRPHAPVASVASLGTGATPGSFGDEPWAAADVSDLDRTALRRLLDRLGATAPGGWTASVNDRADVPEAYIDDDTRVNDELADLDGPALLRVARSFERPRL
jgi:hypothetical protein